LFLLLSCSPLLSFLHLFSSHTITFTCGLIYTCFSKAYLTFCEREGIIIMSVLLNGNIMLTLIWGYFFQCVLLGIGGLAIGTRKAKIGAIIVAFLLLVYYLHLIQSTYCLHSLHDWQKFFKLWRTGIIT